MVSNDTLKRRSSRACSKELSSEQAIAAAKAAFQDRGTFLFGSTPGKLEANFMELGLLTVAERNSAVDDALSEIKPCDRMGPQPPNNISIHPYGGRVLYAFIWKSSAFGSVYLKFCLTGATGVELLVLHSFHHEGKEIDEKS